MAGLDDFETQDLLQAIDDLDEIRGLLADGPNLEPPQIRTDLMNLHGLAMDFEGGDTSELIELAMGIEDDDVETIRDASERILEVLRGITESEMEEE